MQSAGQWHTRVPRLPFFPPLKAEERGGGELFEVTVLDAVADLRLQILAAARAAGCEEEEEQSQDSRKKVHALSVQREAFRKKQIAED